MPGDFGKMPKVCSSRQTKVTVLWFVNAQIESIKGKKQISPYTTFIVLTADIFEIAATEGSYVMEG
jgi:hypothetical protein